MPSQEWVFFEFDFRVSVLALWSLCAGSTFTLARWLKGLNKRDGTFTWAGFFFSRRLKFPSCWAGFFEDCLGECLSFFFWLWAEAEMQFVADVRAHRSSGKADVRAHRSSAVVSAEAFADDRWEKAVGCLARALAFATLIDERMLS